MLSDQDLCRTTLRNEEKMKDISDVESGELQLARSEVQSNRHRHVLIAAGSVAILTTLLYFTLHGWISPRSRIDQCGTSADEARARGCVFETTGFSWVTKECYDPETEADFLEHITANDIKLFRDVNFTQVVPMEEVRQGNGEGFFVYQEYHVAHCLFLVEKLHRALAAGKPLDGYTMPFTHTKHCIMQSLLPPGARQQDRQASIVKWPYCGRPGGYNVDWRKKDQWVNS